MVLRTSPPPRRGRRQRRLSHQNVARLRRLLQPSGDVHSIPGRQPLLGPRHHPNTITVTLTENAGTLTGEIQDDGCGFDIAHVRARPSAALHLGLDSLTERVQAAGGSVDVDSKPGRGTRLRLNIPATPAPTAE